MFEHRQVGGAVLGQRRRTQGKPTLTEELARAGLSITAPEYLLVRIGAVAGGKKGAAIGAAAGGIGGLIYDMATRDGSKK